MTKLQLKCPIHECSWSITVRDDASIIESNETYNSFDAHLRTTHSIHKISRALYKCAIHNLGIKK